MAGRYPDLAGQGVLVTGGGSGIGAALVRAFAAEGARVAFLDIAEAESRTLVSELEGKVEHLPHYRRVDLRDIATLRAAVEEAAGLLGGIRVLVNNAARDDRHDLETVQPDYWDENQAVNLRHHFFAAQAVVPHMREGGGGAIVNFSSIAYLLNMGELPGYAAAKAGIIGLTKSLAGRLGPDNIRVNAILPGMVLTERQKRLWIDEAAMAGGIARQCLKRSLVAEDMAGPCLFLASEASAAITAQTLIVDGGML
ncbi:SDR family NAD(P)-dependent oxidoreductase [Shinella fusca]|jgi:NAD(P)-dependent dehydrogenase (short-subunit alcohol dehydrogenase family)|uniref:NAD(P)-dependent dehydrogenase (Short-subunit alcohol dehydrogenase family) n=1 Tax=Shinella fusca TaxID=544480 RepID=A0A7W8DW95_9HYPH|nr:SDR family oxidoreductase [Shinella fusca]MBB5044869.1 NAD(P)-dependent dehydrogenase (short-subunit alcohol dehydrogenase family) [Shinella fusca]